MTETEFLKFMRELARRDPELYELVKAEAWAMVVENHQRKTPAEIAAWMGDAS